ncbi:MAG: hypothetical protein IJY19_01955 [Ruminococcus sp.]|nr:hypothetical protein [Ruminococcus sp.]
MGIILVSTPERIHIKCAAVDSDGIVRLHTLRCAHWFCGQRGIMSYVKFDVRVSFNSVFSLHAVLCRALPQSMSTT